MAVLQMQRISICAMKKNRKAILAKGIRSDLLISKPYHQDRLLPSEIDQLP